MERTDKLYHRMANYILLYACYQKDASLYHGKTGIVLAMMMYSNVSNNPALKDYSDELFQTIYDDVNDGMPVGIESGLAGVGYGISMMKKMELIDCDLNDVLSDIDAQIMKHDPLRINDLSFRKGIAGILAYIDLRAKIEGSITTFDEDYMRKLYHIYYLNKEEIDMQKNYSIIDDVECPYWEKSRYVDKKLTLEDGTSYYLFKYCYDKVFYNSKQL